MSYIFNADEKGSSFSFWKILLCFFCNRPMSANNSPARHESGDRPLTFSRADEVSDVSQAFFSDQRANLDDEVLIIIAALSGSTTFNSVHSFRG